MSNELWAKLVAALVASIALAGVIMPAAAADQFRKLTEREIRANARFWALLHAHQKWPGEVSKRGKSPMHDTGLDDAVQPVIWPRASSGAVASFS